MRDEFTAEVRIVLETWSGHGWGPGPWFLLFPLFWVTVFVVMGFLWRRRGWGGGQSHHGSGETVLAERYARGEITEQEYRERLSVLRGGGR